MASIGDVFMQLMFQDKQLVAEATRAGSKAGDAASKSMGQKLKGNLGRTLSAGLGAGAGLAFSAALTGANQLDAAMRQFQADTGATAEEAKAASHAIASMYKDNLQGFDQIGVALSKVHTDLGLTGEAAEDATEKFLKFATATGQEAGASVAVFDDILDAWNLTAEDAGTVMDKLVKSHQVFGGVISESEASLAAMAPAMQAANMSIDDGIALLNLFNAAGIDAAKAPAALAKAVKKLKPGQDLNDLIAQIGAIEDPTLRAQAAMDIFGAKSGIGLAQAIKPGMTSLDALTEQLGDTTDATEEAAESIESGFGAQFQLILRKATGALAEFGTQFGPLLIVASAMGPSMLRGLSTMAGGIAGFFGPKLLGLILPQAVATGTAAGTASGGAFATATAAAAALALPALLTAIAAVPVIITWNIVSGDIERQKKDLSNQVDEFVQTATLDGLKSARKGLIAERERLGQEGLSLIDFLFFPSAVSKVLGPGLLDVKGVGGAVDAAIVEIDDKIAVLDSELQYGLRGSAEGARIAASEVGPAVADGLDAGAEEVEGAADDLIDPVTGLPQKVRKSKSELIDALLEPLNITDAAMDKAFDLSKSVPTTAEREKTLRKFLNDPKVREGLKDSRGAVRLGFQDAVKLAFDELVGYTSPVEAFADAQGNAYVGQIATWRSKIDTAWASATGLASETAGTNAATGFATGLQSPEAKTAIINAVKALAAGVPSLLALILGKPKPSTLPPLPRPGATTPKPKPREFNPRTGFTDGELATGGPTEPGGAYLVGERGPELMIPTRPGQVIDATMTEKVLAALGIAGRAGGGPVGLVRDMPRKQPIVPRKFPDPWQWLSDMFFGIGRGPGSGYRHLTAWELMGYPDKASWLLAGGPRARDLSAPSGLRRRADGGPVKPYGATRKDIIGSWLGGDWDPFLRWFMGPGGLMGLHNSPWEQAGYREKSAWLAAGSPAWGASPAASRPRRRATGGPVTAGTPYLTGEMGRELYIPRQPVSRPLGAVQGAQGRDGGGNTYQVNVAGLLRARDPLEVANQLRRLADFGVLTPQRGAT